MISALLNNRYRLIEPLGSGGFSNTFLAEDTYLPSGRRCVIKQLRPVIHDANIHQLVQERFQREAAILEALGNNHHQIPCLYAYFSEGDKFYLVQEWIEGITLEQSKPLTCDTLRHLLFSLLPVLDYVHRQGVIHRDIKPANVIWRRSDQTPVLIDFGVAKELLGDTQSADSARPSIVVGTPGFIPPEQAAGQPVYASDLYSLAMTAIYLVTGSLPRHDVTTGNILWNARDLDSTLVAVLKKAGSYHARDRYPTASAMLNALQAEAFPSLALTAPPPSVPPAAPSSPSPPLPPTLPHASRRSYPSRQDYRNQQILLNKVRNYWIKGVLETSLHDRALLELGLDERPDLLDRPWGMVWQAPNQSQQPLPRSTTILQKFDELGAGRTLLILGEPGAGKTTTLLELARDLLQRAEQAANHPLPVVFNLSSWSDQRPTIADWLVEEMHSKYQVSREIGRSWLASQHLLPMLDGLDEMNAAYRDACVKAINQFMQDYGQTEVVVCSRVQDYERLSQRLRMQAALLIQPLSLDQVQAYLARAGNKLAAVRTAMAADTVLQELARSPLMLNLITLTYQGMSITELPSLSLEERRSHLFTAYINRMFQRRGNPRRYPQHKAQFWLAWLARMMVEKSQAVFLIEGIQPDWLEKQQQRWAYAIGVGILTAPCFAIGTGIVGYLLGGVWTGIMAGAVFGIGGGLAGTMIYGLMHHQINTVETLKWSWIKAKQYLRLGLGVGLVSGVVLGIGLGIAYGYILNMSEGLLFGLLYGPIAGMSIGLVFVLLQGLMGPSVSMKTIPNQGIRQSFKNAAIFAFVGELGLGLTAAAAEIPIVIGVIIGLLFGMFGAGEACIKHITLRLVLYANGVVPWNYANFLDYATDLIFLQKVGGGYIFIHRLLLEHFAKDHNLNEA
jgi:serine/threonine protein kinase